MCAHQPKRSSQRNDDEERRERVEAAKEDETLNDEQVKRLARKHLPWRDWIYSEYLIYWYWLAFLACDVFVLLDIAQRFHVKDGPGILALVGVFGILVCLEYLLFAMIWRRGSRPDEEFWRRG